VRKENVKAKTGRAGDRFQLALVTADLPAGFAALRAEARAEGYRFVERLANDWTSQTMRFDREGEALIAAHVDGVLAGVGGLTIDPFVPAALRMRRFYVRAAFRRKGVGRRLAVALLARAGERPITVNAGPASFPFWESIGFVLDPRDGHTHTHMLKLNEQ
jgi:GNAT superfamily N-acetyltransferase